MKQRKHWYLLMIVSVAGYAPWHALTRLLNFRGKNDPSLFRQDGTLSVPLQWKTGHDHVSVLLYEQPIFNEEACIEINVLDDTGRSSNLYYNATYYY